MNGKKILFHIFILSIISLAPFIGIIGCGGIDCDKGCVCGGCDDNRNTNFGILTENDDDNNIFMNSCFYSWVEKGGGCGCGPEIKKSCSMSTYCYNCADCGDCFDSLHCVKDTKKEYEDYEEKREAMEDNEEIGNARAKVLDSMLTGACGIGCQNGCFEKKSGCVMCGDCTTSNESLNGCTFGCAGGCPKLKCGKDIIYKELEYKHDKIYKKSK